MISFSKSFEYVLNAFNIPQQRHLGDALTRVGPTMVGTGEAEYGISAELSSATGDFLAVGAPRHGYSSPNPDPAKSNIDGGAVFLYNYDGVEWRLRTFFAGLPSEQIGSHLSLSADGSRIAIRRKNALSFLLPNKVEVYNVGANGVPTKVGSDLSCGGNGDSVSLSSDGKRIAISCDGSNGGRGMVQIFEWNDAVSDWVSIGEVSNINDTNPGARFGRSVSFDNSGNRLAVSAQNYDFGGITNRGLVRVYDYSGGIMWVQVGGDVLGAEAGDQFGFSMALSGDGLSFVASAPPSASFVGAVQVYSLVSGIWQQAGDIIYGSEAGDKFGRAVSIIQDGSRIAASSYINQNQRGVVKVFDLVDNLWTLTSKIEGGDALDRLGYGLKSVASTADGTRVVTGSTGQKNPNGVPTGGVSVYSIPRLPLTSTPSSQPTPALNSATLTPSMMLSKFDWDLARIGNATISVNDGSGNEDLTLNYNISNRRTEVTVFQDDCVTTVSNTTIAVSSRTTIKTATHSNLKVALNMKQVQSILVAGDLPGTGTVSLCVRVDLVQDDINATSVQFHEQKLIVLIDLRQGFTIMNIDEERDAADNEALTSDTDYGIIACQCNETFVCANEILVQGDDLFVCVFSTNTSVSVTGIQSFSLIQGDESLVVDAVIDFVADDLTLVTLLPNMAVIRSQMISEFFAVDDPEDVSVRGNVLLSLVSSSSIRRLRIPIDYSHIRALEKAETGFDVIVTLDSSVAGVSGTAKQTSTVCLLLLVGAVLFV